MEDVCARQNCGKRGHFKQCGRCKMVRYCGQECQRADWSAHKPHCAPNQLRPMDARFEEVVRSGLATRLADAMPKEVQAAFLGRALQTGTYQDTRADVGHGVKVGICSDGYWISLKNEGAEERINLGRLGGMMEVSNAMDAVLRAHQIPIKGQDACLKLMESMYRVFTKK